MRRLGSRYFEVRTSNKSTNLTPRLFASTSRVSRVGFARAFSIRLTAACSIPTFAAKSSWVQPFSRRRRRTARASAFATCVSRDGKRSPNPDRTIATTSAGPSKRVHMTYHIFAPLALHDGLLATVIQMPRSPLTVRVAETLKDVAVLAIAAPYARLCRWHRRRARHVSSWNRRDRHVWADSRFRRARCPRWYRPNNVADADADAHRGSASVDRKESLLFGSGENVTAQEGPVPVVFGEFVTGSVVISSGLSTEEIGTNPTVNSEGIFAPSWGCSLAAWRARSFSCRGGAALGQHC